MPDWSEIATQLRQAGVACHHNLASRPVGGGDISSAWHLHTGDIDIFLKTGPTSSADMFAAEAEGLSELASANAVRVPAVLAVGQASNDAFLALEWLSFERPSRNIEIDLGRRLAMLHRKVQDRFGWHRNNTIGLTPQKNEWSTDWVEFFRERRLGYQLKLARENGFTGELQQQGHRLLERLPAIFADYEPLPSLLHGDLWGGNWASAGGEPVIFDPAVYYGDRETDLAMTRLFGGFGRGFYEAYEAAWPLQAGSPVRQQLYQLYHVLNHLNLFGGAYRGRALALIEALL